ncbi:MAG: hypothetical protein IPH52_13950 [Leptospiraceae bacterium]|nr:hypothetical protein [Leptospiraceae bacterium]
MISSLEQEIFRLPVFFVEWLNCPLELNQEVNVTLYIDKQTLELKAGVVRLDSVGAGIIFSFLRCRFYKDNQRLDF